MGDVKKHIKILLATAFACGLFLGAACFAMYQSTHQPIQNVGVIRTIGVEVYADAELTEILYVIEWGIVSPGENKSHAAWVKNTGNDAQKLVMWTEAWNPTNASAWITLTWDYEGSWIQVNASIPVLFTLHVDPNIEGVTDFSFELWVKGVH